MVGSTDERLIRALDDLTDMMSSVKRALDAISINPERYTRHSRISEVPANVPAGEREEIFSYRHRAGLIDHLYIKVNQKDCSIVLKIDGEETVVTPEELADKYYATFNPRTMFLTEYDETAGSYQLLYTPLPMRPYEDHYELLIISPASSVTQVEVDEVHFEERTG